MKKIFKLFTALPLAFSMLLAGCGNKPAPTPSPTPEVVHVTGVTTTEDAFTLEVGEAHDLVYTIAPEDAADKSVTVASESACVSIEGTTVTGELAGDAEVLLTTVDGNFSITYTITVVEPALREFPTKDVIAFYEEAGIDVVVPSYTAASEAVEYEIDTETDGVFFVWVNDTTSAELVAYKEALKTDGWVVISDDEETSEDFGLQFGETLARVSLADFTAYAEEGEAPYVGVAFSVYEAEAYTPETGIKHIAEHISQYFQSPITAQQDAESGEWYIGINLGTGMTVEALKGYVTSLFIPDDFTISGDWNVGQFSDGTEVNYLFAVCTPIYAEFDVYAIENVGTILQIQCFDIPQE